MLNELLSIERGLTASGMPVAGRHRDLANPGKIAAVQCRMAPGGTLAEIAFLSPETVSKLWTWREPKHNSFPFIQLKKPLLGMPEEERWQKEEANSWKKLRSPDRHRHLRAISKEFHCIATGWMDSWPGAGLKDSLRQRLASLVPLRATEAGAVPAVVERFLAASECGRKFLGRLIDLLLMEVDEAPDDCLDLVHDLLTRKGPLYIDVARGEFRRDVAYPAHVNGISRALSEDGGEAQFGKCALMGQEVVLHTGSFPQPNIPIIGETYIFSKNADIGAAGRYDCFAADAFPVGSQLIQRLGQVLREVTSDDRRGKTWRGIPSERPKQSDLLLAFVRDVPDAAVAEIVADHEEHAWERASYRRRTQRVIDAIKGKVGEDFRQTPVDVCVLRKVDPGNKKIIYHRALFVGDLWDAALAWAEAQENLPNWLQMPLPGRRGEKADWRGPAHLAPLQLPALTRLQYIRGGAEKQEVIGLSAGTAFSLFLNDSDAFRRARLALLLVMDRHGPLLSGIAQALRKGFDHVSEFDGQARSMALRSLTLLGVLLRKIGRGKETYMDETAFKLGQLLAVADTVHVGYCADRRGGDVPPVLLGNSVLTMAQSSPSRALAALGRRWKPYAAWAKSPATRELGRSLRGSKDPKEVARGWDIIRATSSAYRAADLTRELHGHLPMATSDSFRAELLLGYVTGLSKREKIEGPLEGNDDTETE